MSSQTSKDNDVRFGLPLRPWQRECASLNERFQVLALHRRAGKTEIALKRLLNAAVKNDLELPHYAYVAPLLKQAKIIAWARLKQMVGPLVQYGTVDINESELFVKFNHSGAIIRIIGADNPDGLRGVRLDGCVLDETAQMKPEVWEEIIQPALSDRKGWALFIGTPKGINLFSDLFFKANGWPDWVAKRYTVYDTDALDSTEVERLRLTMSETAFAREMLCDFEASGDDQLLSLTDVEAASRRTIQDQDYNFAPKIIGVDPARFGNDRSVIFKRQGLMSWEPIVYRGIDNMELAARVAHHIMEWGPDAVFIDAGNGSGVIDRLRQLGHDVVEVGFGTKPTDPRFNNKRTEIWYEMADWIRSGGVISNNTDLKLELATPTYSFSNQGKIVLESKDDIKERMPGGASPDCADGLALTFSFPVHKASPVELARQAQRREYNPYSNLV